eukprot:2310936-Amphidinium_carterae.1
MQCHPPNHHMRPSFAIMSLLHWNCCLCVRASDAAQLVFECCAGAWQRAHRARKQRCKNVCDEIVRKMPRNTQSTMQYVSHCRVIYDRTASNLQQPASDLHFVLHAMCHM